MSLKEIIEEIRKLNTADQHRLKQFFVNSLASYSASEPVFKEVSERNHKEGYTCTHCHSTKVVRFGKYSVKMDMRLIQRMFSVQTLGEPLRPMRPIKVWNITDSNQMDINV
ncbi:hypothetical protein [Enterococcus gallinarum]|uniref:hypothetical protein n=1 Tax=Enterococcus gallinarum TaxID=1353 RepID=UPI003B96959F